MDSTFSHLRDVDVFKKQTVRSSHSSDGSLNSYKQESQGKISCKFGFDDSDSAQRILICSRPRFYERIPIPTN